MGEGSKKKKGHPNWHLINTRKREKRNYKFYLPYTCVIDTVPTVWSCSFLHDLPDSASQPRRIRDFGLGRFKLSLLNIRMTLRMSGRSSARSCTHSSAMWMHLETRREEHDSLIDGSINSIPLSSFHCCHAWKMVVRGQAK
jgi:hypothetical protein